MLRIPRLIPKLNPMKQLIRQFRSAGEEEMEQKLFYKKKLDPYAVELFRKYESDIVHSSYVETNKKPLQYKKRMILRDICEKNQQRIRYEEASRKPFSLALKYISNKSFAEKNVASEVTMSENRFDEESKQINLDPEPDSSRKIILNETKLAIFKEMQDRRMELEEKQQKYPDKWMQDYETYDELEEDDDELVADSQYGTPDPKVPISKIPCHGCGALLQCADVSLPGYLPSELIRGQSDSILRSLICQRCHFLKNYNTALQLKVNPEEYVKMITSIQDQFALVILMVDLVDFPCSIWPEIVNIIGPKRPVFIVGNKVDLLPQDSKKYLDHIKQCLENSLIISGLTATNIKHTCLISAETNYGVEDLITNLHNVWAYKGDVYLVGCTNVGKSTLFNALLRSDYCKSKASNIIKRATASIWPGTTLRMLKFPILRPSHLRIFERYTRLHNEQRKLKELNRMKKEQVITGNTPQTTLMGHIGQTFSEYREEVSDPFTLSKGQPDLFINEKSREYARSNWFFDTPGVVQNDQIINLLTTEELLYVIPKKVLWPRIFMVKQGQSLFLAGLGRIDFIGGSERLRLAVYASDKLPILIANTEKADEVYRNCLGSELLCVPRGDDERLQKWPSLVRSDNKISVSGYESENKSVCDIVLSSAGWVSVNIPRTENATFYAWTPECRGIYVRKPAILPYGAMEYRGKRIRETSAYNLRIPTNVTF